LSAPQTIAAPWKGLENQTVASYRLQSFLGGTEVTAVFSTARADGRRAAIKLTTRDERTAELRLSQWQRAMRTSHPHLLQVFDAGTAELNGRDLLWVLMEFADDDLSQILPLRPITAGEAEQMLPPVLSALSYLHREGLAHGRLKHSNIMAIGDQVKLSSDSIAKVGDPLTNPLRTPYDAPEVKQGRVTSASDVWSLGVTLVEVLTRTLPTTGASAASKVAAPFAELVSRCLQMEAGKRITTPEILPLLKPATPVLPVDALLQAAIGEEASLREETKRRNLLFPVVAVVAAALILAVLVFVFRRNPAPPNQNAPSPPAAAVAPATPESPAKPDSSRPSVTDGTQAEPPSQMPGESGSGNVLHQVQPSVSAGARNTVQGRVRVVIRAKVDVSGNVTEAGFQSHGPSEYFARKAREAAVQWKFAPGGTESVWLIRFGFGPKDTLMSASPLK